MSDMTVGTCSICAGAVTVPNPWWATTPPVPKCSRCGAVPVEAHGPTIPMRPSTTRTIGNGVPLRITVLPDGQWRVDSC